MFEGVTGVEKAKELIRQIRAGGKPEPAAIAVLLRERGAAWHALREAADEVRATVVGPAVHLRGIIEFSNYCRQNCLYCGLRRDNRRLRRYRLTVEEVVAIARRAVELGFKTIVLQSGEDPWYTPAELARMVTDVKEMDVAVTLAVGERRRQDYLLWRRAGADRYLLKHETADAGLFARLRPGTSLAGRLRRLYWLKELGYQVGAGNMVGLPGQGPDTLAADLLLMQELDVEMAGIGPFIPNPQTPLGRYPAGDLELTLRVLATARLLLPRAHLPATTAVATLHPTGRRRALQAGANVIMPNVTPNRYRAVYQIYPKGAGQPIKVELDQIKAVLADLGRPVDSGYGHALKKSSGVMED